MLKPGDVTNIIPQKMAVPNPAGGVKTVVRVRFDFRGTGGHYVDVDAQPGWDEIAKQLIREEANRLAEVSDMQV